MRRVLITGVSGFVGSALARCLGAAGVRVLGTYIGAPPVGLDADVEEVDLNDAPRLARLVESYDPTVVVHLAGLSHVGESWQRIADYFKVNFVGSENLFRAAAGRRILFASSAEVYGAVPSAEQPISEDRFLAPATPYALTKAAAEHLGQAAGAIVVRCFNLIGRGQDPSFALPSFAQQLAQIRVGLRSPRLEVGNLDARRDFLHIDDAVRGYALLVDRGEAGVPYNLGSGAALSIRDALDRLMRVAGVEAEVVVDAERYRPAEVETLSADTSRLEALGWRAEKSLEQALADIWNEAIERQEAVGTG